MFEHMSNDKRLERLKKVIETDYTNRHDSAIQNLFPLDLEWLVEQAEKVEKLEKENERLRTKNNNLIKEYGVEIVLD